MKIFRITLGILVLTGLSTVQADMESCAKLIFDNDLAYSGALATPELITLENGEIAVRRTAAGPSGPIITHSRGSYILNEDTGFQVSSKVSASQFGNLNDFLVMSFEDFMRSYPNNPSEDNSKLAADLIEECYSIDGITSPVRRLGRMRGAFDSRVTGVSGSNGLPGRAGSNGLPGRAGNTFSGEALYGE